jgi:hypothetical protein
MASSTANASIIDFSGLTLNTEEARSLSECIQEQVYAKPELTSVHDVQTGVEQDKYIPILGKYGLVGKVDPGSCGVNSESGKIPTSQKTWTPKLISFRLAHCQDDIPNLLKFWKKSRIAAKTWEEVDNEMLAFINDRVSDAVLDSILRISEFGDIDSALVAGGGYITAGTTITYFNMLDGMWKQIFEDQAGNASAYRHTISENALTTKALQIALATDTALKVFRNLYNNADSRIFEGNNPAFQVTKSLFDNWQDYMEDKSAVFTLDRVEQGSTKWSYRGIPIVVRKDWDRTIRSYHDLSTTYYLPHRAILTDINNIPVGTSDSESLTTLDSFYDKKDKTHYIDVAYKLDQKNLQEELMAVAY